MVGRAAICVYFIYELHKAINKWSNETGIHIIKLYEPELLTDRRLWTPKPSAKIVMTVVDSPSRGIFLLFLRGPEIFYIGRFGRWTVIPSSKKV